jgi:3-hydroxyacyl-CoA dehydrogenase/3a,7a,12a-trihydroxy-5b-cholest-24-enoyl-CoA hydratase
MSRALRFDGKVAIVTGAGNGLGREYALALGARGAKVVVNDLGGDIKGGGASSRPADKVVEEIRSKGGVAVANYDSVEDGEKLVQTALDNFGRIDIVINNAGILRDRSFARISDADWDIIQRVHLRGSFMVTRAAWPHMRKNNYGRVIMTTSAAGIYGNFGQANYSAAKLGLLGLSNTLAIEGKKNNVHCNTIAPVAGSRLTETVMPPDMIEALKPEYVMPLVLWLCHEDCQDTGRLFEVGAGWMATLRWMRSKGAVVRKPNKPMTPEAVRDSWAAITDYSEYSTPTNIAEANSTLYEVLSNFASEEGPGPNNTAGIEPDRAIGAKFPTTNFSYNERDVILYNLGVGVSTQQEDHLKFLFEMHDEFCVLPTYMVIPSMTNMAGLSSVQGLEINPMMILHGEQYLEIFKSIPTEGNLKCNATVVDVLDKGSGALILVNVETSDESGEKVAFSQTAIFVQQAGGFGGKRSSDKAISPQKVPGRAPDASIKEKTGIDQAALYRLSGDRNPLHIDPSFAAVGGFSTPILHGLCSFGYAVRHVLKQYCGNDVALFKAVKVRFSKPVLPGETIQTDMWKEGNRIHFQCKVVESGKVCLSDSYVDLHGVSPAPTSAVEPSSLASAKIFDDIKKRIAANPSAAKKINAIFAFNITKGGKPAATWTADLKSSSPSVYEGEPQGVKAQCTVIMNDEDFVDLAQGKINGQKAFMTGKLKVKGNMMLAQKLGGLFQDQSKL